MRDDGGWGEMQPFTLRSNPFSIVALPPSAILQQMSGPPQKEQQAPPPSVYNSAALAPAEDRMLERRVPEHRVPEARAAEHREAERREAEHRVAEHRAAEHPAAFSLADLWHIQGGRMWLYAAAGLAAVGLVAGGAYRLALRKPAPPPQTAPAEKADASRAHLGFSATRDGPVWKLSWDRASMDALNPVGAVLSIEDGGYLQQVPLAPADLASGILFYTPQSNDLTFDLRIDRGGTHVEEQVRVLAPTRVTFDRAQQSGSTRAPVQAQAAPAVTPSNVQPPAAAATTPPPAAASAPPRRFVLPAATPGESAVALTDPVLPPVVALAVPVAPNLPRANPDFGISPPPLAPPPVTTSAAAAASKGEPAVAAAVLPGARPAPAPSSSTVPTPAASSAAASPLANYVGPRPTRQVSPPAPQIVPPGVTQVEVLIEIDVHGKVTKASPVGWTPANAALMISATRAATSWTFAPAELNGHAVPSQMNLIFKF